MTARTRKAAPRQARTVLEDVLEHVERCARLPACRCGAVATHGGDGRCVDCIRIDSERARLEPALSVITRSQLETAGLSTRELSAVDGYPAPHITKAVALALEVGGSLPPNLPALPSTRGFGLSGGAGTGKTFGLVLHFRRAMTSRLRNAIAARGAKGVPQSWLLWLAWPDQVDRMRVESTNDNGGIARVQQWVDRWSSVECLMLDDLGAEREKEYASDWVSSQLDRVIDARHRAMLPTWYTTNLGRREFATRYGARMFSRLVGANPLVDVKAREDLRMVGTS